MQVFPLLNVLCFSSRGIILGISFTAQSELKNSKSVRSVNSLFCLRLWADYQAVTS
jgi:hypothetical protein